MKESTKNFLNTLADVVDTGYTHVLSFELRKLNPKERQGLVQDLQQLAEGTKETK